jgi:hypothetical protein
MILDRQTLPCIAERTSQPSKEGSIGAVRRHLGRTGVLPPIQQAIFQRLCA